MGGITNNDMAIKVTKTILERLVEDINNKFEIALKSAEKASSKASNLEQFLHTYITPVEATVKRAQGLSSCNNDDELGNSLQVFKGDIDGDYANLVDNINKYIGLGNAIVNKLEDIEDVIILGLLGTNINLKKEADE